jgi:hypothetical protein
MGEVSDPGRKPRPNPVRLLWNGKADGANGGGIAFSIIGDHDNRPTDMTNVVVEYEEDICREEVLQMGRGHDSGITP